MKELHIDGLGLANFQIVVPSEQTRFPLGEASVGEFHFRQGRIAALSDVRVARGDLSASDLAAYAFYGKPYESLSGQERSSVDQAQSFAEKPASPEAAP
jgi:hypothetical protein